MNPAIYWTIRALFVPFFLVYFRMQRIGREHLPASGPLLLASNHRSFLDPFVIGTLVRRPVYYMAKRELFERRWQAWVLNALGAFPVDRGAGDGDAMATARAILERGDCVVVFPEGTRDALGPPRGAAPRHRPPGAGDRRARGAGGGVRHASTCASGWRIRPRRVRLRVGRSAAVPESSSDALPRTRPA